MELSINKKINKKSVWIELVEKRTGSSVRYFDSEAGKREVRFKVAPEHQEFFRDVANSLAELSRHNSNHTSPVDMIELMAKHLEKVIADQ